MEFLWSWYALLHKDKKDQIVKNDLSAFSTSSIETLGNCFLVQTFSSVGFPTEFYLFSY